MKPNVHTIMIVLLSLAILSHAAPAGEGVNEDAMSSESVTRREAQQGTLNDSSMEADATVLSEQFASVVESFRKSYFSELEDNNITGLSVAVVADDGMIWGEGFGVANKETLSPTNTETRYLIGSVTKVFTAFAVMQLVESGLISLDSPLTRYLPGFRLQSRFGPISEITIRHVLTHHAGLPDDVWTGKFAPYPEDYRSLTKLTANLHACYPPGLLRVYSNLGYALLGHLIEHVSGLPYREYIQSKIFNPLGMDSSGFFNAAPEASTFAVPYNELGEGQMELPIRDVPAGAIISTVSDMARFLEAILRLDPALIGASSRAEMFRVQNNSVPLDLDDRVGLCFTLSNRTTAAGRVFEHGGATLYHRAHMYVAPDAGLGAIALSNSSRGVETAWRLNEELLVAIARSRGFVADQTDNPLRGVHFDVRVDSDLSNLAGLYATLGALIDIGWKRNMLHASVQGRQFFLVLDTNDAFVPAKRVLGITFPYRKRWFLFQDIDDRTLFIEAMPWGDLVIVGERVEPAPIREQWHHAIGSWAPVVTTEELIMAEQLDIREDSGILNLSFSLLGRSEVQLSLETLTDLRAAVLGLGRMGGEIIIFDRYPDGTDRIYFKGVEYLRSGP